MTISQFLTDAEVAAGGFAMVGRGVLIHRQANIVFPERIHIGDFVRIDGFTNLIARGGIEIGRNVHIGSFCYLAGGAGIHLADFSGLSQGVKVYSTSDDYSGAAMTNPTVPEAFTRVISGRVVLERHVIVGANSVILPGVVIAEGCSVGALSLVARSLPPWGIYAGCPAKLVRPRERHMLDLEAQYLRADALRKDAEE